VAALAVAASVGVTSAGVAFIDSSDGIHIVQKIVLEDSTDANKPLKKMNAWAFEPTSWHSRPLTEVGSRGGVLYDGSFALGWGEEVHG
jgi:hypothetical protein